MESILVILVLAVFAAPLVLATIALTYASQARKEVEALRVRLSSTEKPPPVPIAVPKPTAPVVVPTPSRSPSPPTPPRAPRPDMEWILGGKAASFAGIAVLVVGIALFIGYAIQHAWIGPGLRVVLGLCAGGALVGAGHLAEIRSTRLRIFARALTGGGSALFYVSAFAAYGLYGLIGPWPAAAALIACAATTFALAALYRSQAVALLGLLGAVLTPPLMHGHLDRGLFPVLYLAAVNVPVLILGHRRNWQVLYNAAAVATLVLAAAWLDRELPQHAAWAYACVTGFYLQFAALSALRLRSPRTAMARQIDLIRQALLGLALLGALRWIPEEADHTAWTGAIFLLAAITHVVMAVTTRRIAGDLREEALGFLLIALTFASLALPVQLDGAWVSLGWGIEGLLLCAFALRLRSGLLQSVAFGLAILGLVKSAAFDWTTGTAPQQAFLNSRFAVGLISTILLFLQGTLHARSERAAAIEERPGSPPDALRAAALLAAVLVPIADLLITASPVHRFVWFGSSLIWGAVAALMLAQARPGSWSARLALILLGLLPVKLVVETFAVPDLVGFSSPVWAMQGLLLAAAIGWVGRRASGDLQTGALLPVLHLTAALSGLLLISREITALRTPWSGSLLTIVWALAACALVATGWVRRARYFRYAGLALFGVTLLKVFLIDLSDLRGLERIAAFVAAGLLLLAVSFVYQRITPRAAATKGQDG